MNAQGLIKALAFVVGCCGCDGADSPPGTLRSRLDGLDEQLVFRHPGGMHTQQQVADARRRVLAGDEPWRSAWSALLKEADAGLREKASAVRNLDIPGFYDDADGHRAARAIIGEDSKAAYACALAWAIGADLDAARKTAYARKTVELLDAWATVKMRGERSATTIAATRTEAAPPARTTAVRAGRTPQTTDARRLTAAQPPPATA